MQETTSNTSAQEAVGNLNRINAVRKRDAQASSPSLELLL
jgi:hypothetical protein